MSSPKEIKAMQRNLLEGSGAAVPTYVETAVPLGFEVYDGGAAFASQAERMAQGENFEIIGSDFSQILELSLPPGSLVTAEPGTMLHMSAGLGLSADMGGFGQGCKRCCCAGESMFRVHLENNTNEPQRLGLTPVFPSRVVPINLKYHSGMVMNSGAFMAALGKDWRVELRAASGVGAACCAGQGLFLTELHGDGLAFMNAGGTVLTKQLAPGEELVVDKHSLLAFEKSVKLGIKSTGSCMVCCCASMGLYNAVLTGPGFVMLHSMGLSKLRRSVGRGGGGNNNDGGS